MGASPAALEEQRGSGRGGDLWWVRGRDAHLFFLCEDWGVTRNHFTELEVLKAQRAERRKARNGSMLQRQADLLSLKPAQPI